MSRGLSFRVNKAKATSRRGEWYVSLGDTCIYLHPDLKLRHSMISAEGYDNSQQKKVYKFGYLKTRKQARELIKQFLDKVIEDNKGQTYTC